MATHSSILAWRIAQIEEPGGLQSLESHRVRHDRASERSPGPLSRRPDSQDTPTGEAVTVTTGAPSRPASVCQVMAC